MASLNVEVKVSIEAVEQALFQQRVAARIEEATRWAIWYDGKQFIGVMRKPLKVYIEEIIREESGRRPPQTVEGS
jgi:hypothetical protein